jgi:hypothetical protein
LDGRAAPAIIDANQAKTFGLVQDICELPKIRSDGVNVAVRTA